MGLLCCKLKTTRTQFFNFNSNNNNNSGITIEALDVRIDKKKTQLDERSPIVFSFKTPHFRASATVRFPAMDGNQCWKIGWIQACTKMNFTNTYGDIGYSSWEFPDLLNKHKSMISDSDGRNFPWYGGRTEVAIVQGPLATPTVYTVSMNDNFSPRITWDPPIGTDRKPRLTNVKRDQVFLTWLVAMDVRHYRYIVLKTFKWHMRLEISVDPLRELGERARLVTEEEPEQPVEAIYNTRIPNCALNPINANGSQVLVWYPKVSGPLILIAPKCLRINDYKRVNWLKSIF